MGGLNKSIAVFSGIFHPESGGPATYLYNLCNSLTEKGYDVKVLCFGEKQSAANYNYPVTRISRRYPVVLRFLLYFLNIFQFHDVDLFFISDYGFPVALANIFLRKKTIIKIVGDFAWEKSVRDGLTKDNIDNFQVNKQHWLAEFYKKIQYFYVSRSNKIITPSKYLSKIIQGWGMNSSKLEVIYNAIELQMFKRKQRPEGQKVLLTVARLVPWKGIDKVIAIIPELKRNFTNIQYQVIGDGPDLARLQKIAGDAGVENEVVFLGKKSNQEVIEYMSKADLFVLYSDYEGLPHVVLEAMAVGLPALVSNKGGNPEVIEIGKCGRICKNDADLVKDISQSLAQPLEISFIPEEFKYKNLLNSVIKVIEAMSL